MAERYTRVAASKEALYAENAPIVLEAAALLKDNKTGGLLAQLKWKNVSMHPANINALTVQIIQLDVTGKEIGTPVNYQYLDISIPRDTEYGAKTPIPLTDLNTRKIRVAVTEAVFEDGYVEHHSALFRTALPPREALGEPFLDSGLIDQFKREFGQQCSYNFWETKLGWLCPCGLFNHPGENSCHSCGVYKPAVLSLDREKLQWRNDDYRRKKAEDEKRRRESEIRAAEAKKRYEEQKRREDAKREAEAAAKRAALARERQEREERIAAEKRQKRIKRGSVIVVAVIALCILLFGVLPTYNANIYENATSLMFAGEYEAAKAQFDKIPGYKDAKSCAADCANVLLGDYSLYIRRFALYTFVVPDGTTHIRENAFAECTTLTSITLCIFNSLISDVDSGGNKKCSVKQAP